MISRSILQVALCMVFHFSLSMIKLSCGQPFNDTTASIGGIRTDEFKPILAYLLASDDSKTFEALTSLIAEINNAQSTEALSQFVTLIASPLGPLAFPYSLDFNLTINSNYTYDYIIIGAGSAGSTLAARLTEDTNVRVLIIEAGGEENLFNNVPLFAGATQKSSIDWAFESVPQSRAAFGLNDEKIPIPRGKVVGGSSSINAMLYVRGNPLDYDIWEELGATGWNYSAVFPYFIKMEGSRDPRAEPGYHGTTGPLTVSPLEKPYPVDTAFLEGCSQIGLIIGDFNGANQQRFKYSSYTTRDGKRCSTGRAYLGPASSRPNLDVLLYSRATKVLFDDNKRAIGVEFTNDLQKFQVFARREVILSAGAIQTPQLLMLSGIGPKDELTKFGIPIIQESPGVGNNLYDHPFTMLLFTTRFGSGLVPQRPDTLIQLADYLVSSTGLFTGPGVQVMGFLRTSYAMDERPDIQVHEAPIVPDGIFADLLLSYVTNIRKDLVVKYLLPYVGRDGTTYLVTLIRPRSTGTVRLASADPREAPIIDLNLFDDSRDIDTIVEGCKLILNITRTPAMQAIEATRFTSELGDCSQYPLDSDPYLRCLTQTLTFTIYHPTSTAKMGSADDPMAVVDPTLHVYGVKNLMVVDASVMPQVTTGNTNAPTIMIAERAADLMKGRVLRAHRPPFTNEQEITSDYVQTLV